MYKQNLNNSHRGTTSTGIIVVEQETVNVDISYPSMIKMLS